MTTVATVLRSGGEYTPEHARAILSGLARYRAPGDPPVRFVVLTDLPYFGVERIPLSTGWPGWWAKMELFRPGFVPDGERVFYLDLDTVVTGSLSDLLGYEGEFAALADFYWPASLGSGVMAWKAGTGLTKALWDAAWRVNPNARDTQLHYGSDQGLIQEVVGRYYDRIQALYPEQVVSYKVHCQGPPPVLPENARLVCAHGVPKPWHPEWVLPELG